MPLESNNSGLCPICDSNNGCFEKCFEQMLAWYQRHYPEFFDEYIPIQREELVALQTEAQA